MSYSFKIIGVSPLLAFFNYQQQMEQNPRRSKAHLGSYECTLDGFIQSTDLIPRKPDWDWDAVINAMVNFWLKQEDDINFWQQELQKSQKESIIVARVVNFEAMRQEFEDVFEL
jgi:hypothetical protein